MTPLIILGWGPALTTVFGSVRPMAWTQYASIVLLAFIATSIVICLSEAIQVKSRY
jgi:hypothetical protein